ncbi:MAG TPA: pilus assembly protein TadG-related protein [Candidatus Acidoferrales bacterium]|nr:pilus assembly protein TadG-related protein [Candidatus Acidoferrales bacterium]
MKRNKQAGQALVLTAVALVVLMGFAGLAIDVGALRSQKRLQQTAADAAAIAGANNLSFGGVTAGAQNAAAGDNFTDNSGNAGACGVSGPPAPPNTATPGWIEVTVCNGPSTGPHQADANYVEAWVTEVQPTYFMRVLGINQEVVTARAVATNINSGGPTGPGCLYTLGPPTNQIEGVNINGHATLNAPSCGIVDNGDYNTKGNALTVSASTFGVSGSANVSGPGGSVTCSNSSTCPQYGMPAATDPLAGLTPPCSPCTGGTAVNATSTTTINPGTYTSISLSGNGTVTFNPGVYVLDGTGAGAGITCNGTPTLNGNGVVFYFTGGSTFNCTGNDTINLVGPSSSTCPSCPSEYDGILMYQDPNDTVGPSLGGNTGANYQGVLYFPSSEVTFFGNNSSIDTAMVVADAFALSGNPTVNLQGQAGLPPGVNNVTAIKQAVLVE